MGVGNEGDVCSRSLSNNSEISATESDSFFISINKIGVIPTQDHKSDGADSDSAEVGRLHKKGKSYTKKECQKNKESTNDYILRWLDESNQVANIKNQPANPDKSALDSRTSIFYEYLETYNEKINILERNLSKYG